MCECRSGQAHAAISCGSTPNSWAKANKLALLQCLAGARARVGKTRNPLDGIDREAETIGLIVDRKRKRCIDVSLLLKATDMDVVLTGTTIGQAMDHPSSQVRIGGGSAFTLPTQPEKSAHAKRVRDAEPVLDDQTIVHVFRPEGVTIRVKCRGCDHRVVDRKAIPLGYRQSQIMHVRGHRLDRQQSMRIPMKSAMHSNLKPATASELKPAGVPI